MSINDSKLLRIISTFSQKDWKEFSYYLKSPYFVRGRDYTNLYQYIYKAYKSNARIDSKIFSNIISKIILNENIDKSSLQSRLYELTTLAVNFLKQKLSEKNELERNYYILRHFSDYLLFKDFDAAYNINFDDITTSELTIEERQIISNILPYKISRELLHKRYNTAFDLFHKRSLLEISRILESVCYEGIESYKLKSMNAEQGFNPINEIINNIDLQKIMKDIIKTNSPVFSRLILYYYLYEIIVNDKGKEYLGKLESLYFNPNSNHASDLKEYFSILIKEYYQLKINQGDDSHIKPLFRMYINELINGKINNRIILHREQIFDNYVATGLKAEEFEFVRNFINDNIDSLPKDKREEVYILSMVRLYFAIKEYKKALNVIENRKKRKIQNGLILRFKMRLFYELSMLEEAFLEVDRIKHFIKNNKIMRSDEKKKTLLFITHYLKLLKLKTSPELKTYDDFIVGLNKSKVMIPSGDWLKLKAEELKR